jgi:cell division protein FtsL
VSEFKFQNVHRLGERKDGKERSIIARFTRYSDHERVRSIAMEKLKEKPQFTVYEQYLREIYERRRNLIPKMKELKRQKHTVKLEYDKLIVDGLPYNSRDDPHPGN